PVDYSVQAGDTTKAVIYSFSGAMSPGKKESAYLHLPTYTAGILYHLGTFASVAIFLLLLSGIILPGPVSVVLAAFFGLTLTAGLLVLIKRITKSELRSLSNPDDYISNILVTGTQVLTALVLLNAAISAVYFLWVSLLLLYIPVGKLKHAIYFFAARYHLGYYFGYRDTWPEKGHNKLQPYDGRE
ncbi:MAG: hypothetical protein R6W67_11185, partial [Bacteroidales bacterium]